MILIALVLLTGIARGGSAEGIALTRLQEEAVAGSEISWRVTVPGADASSRVVVSAYESYPNGTADLLLLTTLPAADGEAVFSLTPQHRGELRVEARLEKGSGIEAARDTVAVQGKEESWPLLKVTGADERCTGDEVLWEIVPSGGTPPYRIHYSIHFLKESGEADAGARQTFRAAEGEKVYARRIFGEPGRAVMEAEVADDAGLRCVVQAETLIVLRPFTAYSDRTELTSGESLTLHIRTPEDPWHFKSSDEGVLQVDQNGTVTARGAGNAVITVSSAENDHEENVRFWVRPGAEKIECRELILQEGQTGVLHPELLPEGSLDAGWFFVPVNDRIASVDAAGNVTAGEPGETGVLVIAAGDPGITALVRVKVLDAAEKRVQSYAYDMRLSEDGKSVAASYGSQLSEGGEEYVLTLLRDGRVASVLRRSEPGEAQFPLTGAPEGEIALRVETTDRSGVTSVAETKGELENGEAGPVLRVTEEKTPQTFADEIRIENIPQTAYAGNEIALGAAILPEGTAAALRWESSDPSIAQVDQEGNVRIVSGGTAVITASALDGSGASTSVKLQCAEESIRANVDKIALKLGESTPLEGVSGTGTNYQYAFTSEDESVVRIEKGNAVPVGEGSTYIRYTAQGTGLEGVIPVRIEGCAHTQGHWEVRKEATCTEDGETVFRCEICGADVESRTIQASGHDSGRWETSVPALPKENGERVLKCTVCGEILERDVLWPLCCSTLNGNTACAEGLYFRDLLPVEEWYMFTPIDLSRDGLQTFRLLASNMYQIGTVYVTVKEGTVTVSYDLVNSVLKFSDEFFTFLPELSADQSMDIAEYRNFAYNIPYSIEGDLNGDTHVLLFMCNHLNYSRCTDGLVIFGSWHPDYQERMIVLREELQHSDDD